MHENSLLRREWTDRRVGRVRRSDSREEAYISSESWLDDYACAFVLSGWPSIHWGRKCPTKQCIIPETDHRQFNEFIGKVYIRTPIIPAQILHIWGCMLLLWHYEVKAVKDDSGDIVVLLEQYLAEPTLRQWNICIKEAYRVSKQSTLSLESVQQLPIAENLTWQNSSLATL